MKDDRVGFRIESGNRQKLEKVCESMNLNMSEYFNKRIEEDYLICTNKRTNTVHTPVQTDAENIPESPSKNSPPDVRDVSISSDDPSRDNTRVPSRAKKEIDKVFSNGGLQGGISFFDEQGNEQFMPVSTPETEEAHEEAMRKWKQEYEDSLKARGLKK